MFVAWKPQVLVASNGTNGRYNHCCMSIRPRLPIHPAD